MTCRCVDCGFLVLVNAKTMEKVQPDSDYRRNGCVPAGDNYLIYKEIPRCWRNVPIESEAVACNVFSGHAVATATRVCGQFVPWTSGLSPEKIEEMELVREVQRLNNEAARQQHLVAEKWHNEQVEIARESNRIACEAKEDAKGAWKLAVGAMVVAVLCAVISPVASWLLGRQ